jgi:hypothetical protein
MTDDEKEPVSTYEIWSYDVWGNEDNGYEVNDRFNLHREYPSDNESLTDEEIKGIIEEYFGDPDYITVDNRTGDGEHIYLVLDDDENTDYPIGEIQKN